MYNRPLPSHLHKRPLSHMQHLCSLGGSLSPFDLFYTSTAFAGLLGLLVPPWCPSSPNLSHLFIYVVPLGRGRLGFPRCWGGPGPSACPPPAPARAGQVFCRFYRWLSRVWDNFIEFPRRVQQSSEVFSPTWLTHQYCLYQEYSNSFGFLAFAFASKDA